MIYVIGKGIKSPAVQQICEDNAVVIKMLYLTLPFPAAIPDPTPAILDSMGAEFTNDCWISNSAKQG